jgi:2-C-methyl-D-erythritol 4-phosphate cytidylyltransferase
MPVRDTMKRTDGGGNVVRSEPREGLWHAFTPQMFRLGELQRGIAGAVADGAAVTDEASAMEWRGAKPLMVEGKPDNIKITRPGDLELAAFFLAARQ